MPGSTTPRQQLDARCPCCGASPSLPACCSRLSGALTATGGLASPARRRPGRPSPTRPRMNIPAPPSSNFAGSSGGDGWGLAMTSTAGLQRLPPRRDPPGGLPSADRRLGLLVGAEDDHRRQRQQLRHVRSTGAVDGPGHRPPVRVRHAASDTTAGRGLHRHHPAGLGNGDPFCGFTPLSAVGEAPLNGRTMASASATRWSSVPTGTPSTTWTGRVAGHREHAAVLQPDDQLGLPLAALRRGYGSGSRSHGAYPAPIAAVGNDVIAGPLSRTDELACFDASTTRRCAGTWPVDPASGARPGPLPDAQLHRSPDRLLPADLGDPLLPA